MLQNNLDTYDIWNNTAIAIVVVDQSGKMIKVNKASCELTGYTEYELLQRTIWDITSPEDTEVSRRHFTQLQDNVLSHYTIEKRYVRKDGSIAWVHLIVTKLLINNTIDTGMQIVFAENIQARKNYEQEMVIAYEQAKMYAMELVEEVKRRQQLSEELQRFLYVAAHDIQEPIRTAANYFQLLDSKMSVITVYDDEAVECVQVINDNLKWASQLIASLLRYSRIGSAELGLVNACDLIEAIKHSLTLLIEEKHAVITVDCDCNLSVIINQINAQRVLQNLVQNALKYSQQNVDILITCVADEGYVKFAVIDNGPGIEKRYHDLIFEPFKRLVKTVDGTGIGLAECKRIVELYGGSIWIDSDVGKGSKFYFTLPLGASDD